MNKYLLPITNGEDVWIEHTSANDIRSAKDKFMLSLIEAYQDEIITDLSDKTWDEFLDIMFVEFNISVGDIYDIEEF